MDPMEELIEGTNGSSPSAAGFSDDDIMRIIGEYEVKCRLLLRMVDQQDAVITALQDRIAFLETDGD